LRLVTQHVDVGDRFAAISEHHGHIGQHPSTVVTRDESTPRHRRGQLPGQSSPVNQQTQRDAARVRHHADTIGSHRQAGRPRSTLHLRSAFRLRVLEPSQVQESQAGQALPCFYTPISPPSRERSGLVLGARSGNWARFRNGASTIFACVPIIFGTREIDQGSLLLLEFVGFAVVGLEQAKVALRGSR